MSSLLSHSRVKLWVWIIIIVAGSLVLLSSMCAVGWWYARRIRARRKPLPSPVLAPTRKVTIRRGRMVSSSRYLSLTGSQFGLGQFMNMEDKDQGEKGRSRSKSPFMWWMSNVQDRSQSQQSHTLSHQQMDEVQSQHSYSQHSYQRPEPAFCNDRHAHKESASSEYSLPSIINGRELAEDARVTPLQVSERHSSSPRNDRYVNFSRAFSPLHQSALSSPSAPKVLSQIIESSPRHSTVSKHTSFVSAKEVVISVEEEAVPATTVPHPAPALRAPPTFPSVPDDLQQSSRQQKATFPRFSFTTEKSFLPSTSDRVVSTTRSVPNNKATISHSPASPFSEPLPPPQHGRTYVDDDSTPPLQYDGGGTTTTRSYALEKRPSPDALHVINPNHPPDHTQSQSSSTNGAFTSPPSTITTTMRSDSRSNPNSYWSSRTDLQPVPSPIPLPIPLPIRRPSKKGNVLRKKSLKRAEIVSWVGT